MHRALVLLLLVALALALPARAAPPHRGQPAPEVLSQRQARRWMEQVARRENRFYQPGVGFDRKSGMTFDGVNIDFRTGKPVFTRNWSAPSKECLHVALLVKAVQGDRTAELMISPDPNRPELAKQRALEVLRDKIASYEKFNRDFPGFGGFLPWYRVENGQVAPVPDVWGKRPDGTPVKGEGWGTRVPSLDNGQLAWSLYYAANTLESLGYRDLARRYRAHFELMGKNVVRIFYDPRTRQMRAEARLLRGNQVPPEKNSYGINKNNPYYLSDAYEGLMLCHFADLFGDWGRHGSGKEAIWAEPRRKPAVCRVRGEGQKRAASKVTLVKPWVGSSHEEWGQLLLPFCDVPLDRTLFENAQRARTAYSADHGIAGLFASTHKPIARTAAPEYRSLLGFRAPGATLERSTSRKIVAPYAAFPLALLPGGKPLFATWLKTMLEAPRMFGPYGMGESCTVDGKKMAPCLTWDGKALPMLAWMGGIRDDVRRYLKRDGKLDPFLARVQADYRLFEGVRIEGTDLPLRPPTATIPRAMPDFVP